MRVGRNRSVSLVSVFFIASALILGLSLGLQAKDEVLTFKRIAEKYNNTPQTTISFRHIVISDFFGTSDTIDGSIIFASDGRYVTRLGVDEYLFDGKCLWEYSSLYAQASRNCLKAGQRLDDSFLFFRHFEEYYQVRPNSPDSVYFLTITEKFKGRAPDSMVVTVNHTRQQIISMEYYDINEELNRILLGEEAKTNTITDSLFTPNFPDSTEILEIPG